MQNYQHLFSQHNAIDIEFNALILLQAIAKKYKIAPYKKNKNILNGLTANSLKGRGMEFAEVRQYLPGDDARNIDWRVTARSGTPHTKVFQQEHNQPIFLIVDLSHSMQFATKNAFKAVVTMQIATLLAFVAKQQKEALNFIIFNDSNKFEILKPMKNNNNTILFIQKLLELQRGNLSTNNFCLNLILQQLSQHSPKNSLIITLSDFFNIDQNFFLASKILAARNELINIRILDPTEKHAPPAGHYPITDQNNSFILNLTKKKHQKKYQELLWQQEQNFLQLCQQIKIAHSEILTNDNFIEKLKNILVLNRG